MLEALPVGLRLLKRPFVLDLLGTLGFARLVSAGIRVSFQGFGQIGVDGCWSRQHASVVGRRRDLRRRGWAG